MHLLQDLAMRNPEAATKLVYQVAAERPAFVAGRLTAAGLVGIFANRKTKGKDLGVISLLTSSAALRGGLERTIAALERKERTLNVEQTVRSLLLGEIN